jgi:hypothetical protein
MNRRLFAALVAASLVSPVIADDHRPAVRLGSVRTDEALLPVRAQIPDTAPHMMPAAMPRSTPNITETRGVTVPAPQMPTTFGGMSYPIAAGAPVAGVTMGPAIPMTGAPVAVAPAMMNPGVEIDAPLVGAPITGATSACDKFWFSGEYLYWWTRGQNLPVLATTGPAASNGILGQPGTSILYGGGRESSLGGSGGRFRGGFWFGDNQCWGFDTTFFFVNPESTGFAADSNTFPLIARPFTNLNQNIPFSQLTAFPDLATGSIDINSERELWGIDANLRKRWARTACFQLDALIGFRYINFDESLTITERFARTPNSPPAIGVPTAASGIVTDSFRTTNDFYGGQLGLQSEWRRGRWFVQSTAKVALGTMSQTITIDGQQTITATNGAVSQVPGGLFALPGANIGHSKRDEFAVVPEAGLNLGWHITPHWRIFVGYNMLYLTSVLRPAEQIDTGLDVTRIPNFPVNGVTRLNTVRPTVPFRETSLLTQGISFGTSFKW